MNEKDKVTNEDKDHERKKNLTVRASFLKKLQQNQKTRENPTQ